MSINADDWFTHDVTHRVRHGEGRVHKKKLRLAFTLRINSYVPVPENSASDALINKQIPKTRRSNHKRMQPDDASSNLYSVLPQNIRV